MSVKYMPFAPGIPWKIKNGVILSKIDLSTLQFSLKDKTPIVTSSGGLIEAYLSLCAIEALNRFMPELSVKWAGQQEYKFLMDIQGLASYNDKFDKTILSNFPTPLFFDKTNNAYLNPFINYLYRKPYAGGRALKDKRVLTKQITEKLLFPWDKTLLPQERNNQNFTELNDWMNKNNIPKYRLALIIPDETEYSIHKISALPWTSIQVKEMAQLFKQKSITTIVATKTPSKYYSPFTYVMPYNLNMIMQMIKKTSHILSRDIDFLFLANCISNTRIYCEVIRRTYDIMKHSRFLERDNFIHTQTRIMPMDIIRAL